MLRSAMMWFGLISWLCWVCLYFYREFSDCLFCNIFRSFWMLPFFSWHFIVDSTIMYLSYSGQCDVWFSFVTSLFSIARISEPRWIVNSSLLRICGLEESYICNFAGFFLCYPNYMTTICCGCMGLDLFKCDRPRKRSKTGLSRYSGLLGIPQHLVSLIPLLSPKLPKLQN